MAGGSSDCPTWASRRANSASPSKCAASRPRAEQDPWDYSAKVGRPLHPQRTVRVHLPRGPETIRWHLDRALHRGDECGGNPQPGKLSSPARVAHVPEWPISEMPGWGAGKRGPRVPETILPEHPACSMGNGVDSAASLARRRAGHERNRWCDPKNSETREEVGGIRFAGGSRARGALMPDEMIEKIS